LGGIEELMRGRDLEYKKQLEQKIFALVFRLSPMIQNCNPNLFENGIADVVIPPSLGMNVGDFEYQDSGSQDCDAVRTAAYCCLY
jgi:hypothetical protein